MMFPVTSRYYGIPIAQFTTSEGRTIAYLRRRFLPPDADVVVLTEHEVTQGERLDNITARYLGDPEQFWRLCDANNAMVPNDLLAEIGRRIKIPLPQGGQ
jgi:hypothetical protein